MYYSGKQKRAFTNLYSEIWASFEETRWNKMVIFAENWIPKPNVKYIVDVYETATGQFTFDGKIYNVARAYNPEYDREGKPIDKVADFSDEWEYREKSRAKKIGDSPFTELTSVRDSLPIQRKLIESGVEFNSELKKGDLVLRPVNCYTTGEKEVQKIPYSQGKDRGWVIRILTKHRYCTKHPIVGNKKGMIVFLDEEPLAFCTGFKIMGISGTKKVGWAKQIVENDFERLKEHYEAEPPHKVQLRNSAEKN